MELIFVSAQPDMPYFIWQIQVYVENFINKGINPKNIHILLGLWNNKQPSENGKLLSERGVNVYFYEDHRDYKFYKPNIKPYLISKWLEEYPEYGKIFFLHDSDIIFRELPDYSKYLEDEVCYLGDSSSYIGYNYLVSCCKRYEKKFENSEKLELLKEMTSVLGIDINCLKEKQKNSGGAQYIIKNTNKDDWYKIYDDSNKIYIKMLEYQKKYPLTNGKIQFWTAEMWSTLWNLWCNGKETKIIDELDFSNGTDTVETYEKKPILHMAGVVDAMKKDKFYKFDFANQNPIDLLKNNINYFDYVDKNSATIKYVEVMKSMAQKT